MVRVDPRYLRLAEVETLLGDASKARERLGWTPRVGFERLVDEMVAADINLARHDKLSRDEGFTIYDRHE